MAKAIITLNTGQKFQSPVENVHNVRRMYKDRIVNIEYPDGTATTETTENVQKKTQPPANAHVADVSIFDQQKAAIASELKKIEQEKQLIKEEWAKIEAAKKSGAPDMKESCKRLSRANLKDKSITELRAMIKDLGTGFKSTERKELEDHIILNQKPN